MHKNRLEAFSDGVIAIIITIMVLEIKVPHGVELSALTPIIPVFLSYVLSFLYLAIYWNNHHHLLQATKHVNGKVLWANQHLLFWLSLIPFVTGWMGENNFARWPVVIYGGVLFLAGVAYYILARSLISLHGEDSEIAHAIGDNRKEKISLALYALYAAAVALSYLHPYIACTIYFGVAILWIIPDRRIEKTLAL